MRKFRRILLLTAVLAGALCVSALAAEPTEAGVYGMTTETGITVTPQKADGTAIDASTQGDYSGYYAGAVKFGVEATGLKAGSQYLLLMVSGDGVPGADNIVYIDRGRERNGGLHRLSPGPGQGQLPDLPAGRGADPEPWPRRQLPGVCAIHAGGCE